MHSGPVITVPAFARAREGVRHFFGTRPDVAGPAEAEETEGFGAVAGTESWTDGSPASTGLVGTDPITVISVKQVHGTDVLVLDRPIERGEVFPGGWDALVTDRPRVLLTVRTADCVPVLMHDPARRVVAAVHAGWRGAVAGIIPRTLSILRRMFGSDIRSMQIGIGPSVGPCCYEVDGPVLDRLRENFEDWPSVVRGVRRDAARLDLRELVRRQAEREGVKREQVQTVRVCTVCHPNLFYSYRREGAVNGTMVSGIMLTEGRPKG